MCSISEDDPAASSGQPQRKRGSGIPSKIVGSIGALVIALLWRALPSVSHFLAVIAGFALACFAFAGSVVWFVDFYISGYFRKCCTTAGHVAALAKKVSPTDGIADLDKIANPEGLSELWKHEIHNNDKALTILLTGVTGYVGRALLFQLLREIANAEEESNKRLQHKIYVMARGKARKNQTAADRLELIRDEPMFAPYKKQWDDVIMAAPSGDLQEDKCGMSEETIKMLREAKITHVVHCAADVNFNRPLPDSAGINISPALQLQDLSKEWPTCKRFVHCSTAFVNPGPGTDEEPMKEELYSLGKYDPQDLYDSMRGDQKLALEAKSALGFPNNYVFSKCVAEHLVVRHNKNEQIELKVVRPAVVGPAWVLPSQGWNGDKPSTISGVFLLWGTRVVRYAFQFFAT
jgi:nucleoside-diphosphate-sugar epimerase